METANIYNVLNLVAILNIIVLCFFLCVRKNNSLPNYILAFIIAIPGLYCIDNILINTDTLKQVPGAFFFVQIVSNLFPLAVYYYFHLLLTDGKKWHKVLLIGSIVTFSYSISLAFYFGFLPKEEQTEYLAQLASDQYPMSMNLYNLVFYIWQMVYLIVLYREIKQYQRKVENNLATVDGVKLLFVKQFVSLLAILNFTLVLFYIILPTTVVDYGVLPVVITIIYGFIIYFSINNNAIFNPESYKKLLVENQKVFHKPLKKGEHRLQDENLMDDKTQKIAEKIRVVLIDNGGFKNPELTLSALAEGVKEQPYLTSQVLNTYYNQTFFEIVNDLRVQEAKKLLESFDKTTDKIENIAYAAGFNSRASFYRAFKKQTGKIPTDFI